MTSKMETNGLLHCLAAWMSLCKKRVRSNHPDGVAAGGKHAGASAGCPLSAWVAGHQRRDHRCRPHWSCSPALMFLSGFQHLAVDVGDANVSCCIWRSMVHGLQLGGAEPPASLPYCQDIPNILPGLDERQLPEA